MKNGNKQLVSLLMAAVMLVLLVPAGMVSAAPLVEQDFVTIPGPDDRMAAEYEFVPKFIDGMTTVEPFGPGWTELLTTSGDPDRIWYAYLPGVSGDGNKGQIGVRYVNVGTYQGKTLDLKITVNDWEQYGTNPGTIQYSDYQIGHQCRGYSRVDQTWEFVESGTDTPVSVSGYMTVIDIDGAQGMRFSQETSAAIDQVYVSGTDNWIQFENQNGAYYFYEADNLNSENDDQFAMFTFTFSNQTELTFEWVIDYVTKGYSLNTNWITATAGGEYFGFIAKKPLATEPAAPYTTVTDTDETAVEENTLDSWQEVFLIESSHSVPDEWEEFYYQNYTFQIQIHEGLDIQDVRIYNLAGTDVTGNFTLSTADNIVTATAGNLSSSAFYYNTYRYQITVQLKEEAVRDGYRYVDSLQVEHQAQVSIDGYQADSNIVTTRLFLGELTRAEIQTVDDETGALLPGVPYEIRTADGAYAAFGTSNADGMVVLSNLVPGAYSLVQLQPHDGYLLVTEMRAISVQEDAVSQMQVRCTPNAWRMQAVEAQR